MRNRLARPKLEPESERIPGIRKPETRGPIQTQQRGVHNPVLTSPHEPPPSGVPLRALIISLSALAVPVTGALAFPEELGEYGALLWLLALVPGFLLAYYRGWRGVATALALGMAALSITQVVATLMTLVIPDMLLGVVVAYLGVSLGLGWVAELLHRDKSEAQGLAYTDLLTRLPNRRHARVFLENEFAAAQRGRLLSIVLFDLDGFKDYNDRYGHAAGDEALKAFADVLNKTTRRMNLVGRFGGEEFLAILAGSDAEGAVVFGERVRSALRERALGKVALTVSGGVATFHPNMRTPDELLASADHALYRAKREGRNCIRLFTRSVVEPGAPDEESPDTVYADVEPEPEGGYPRAADSIGKTQPAEELLSPEAGLLGGGRHVLLVDTERASRALLTKFLAREGFAVTDRETVREGVEELGTDFDLVITDFLFPRAEGKELVRAVKSRWPATQVIVITNSHESAVTVEALKAGADRFITRPFGMSELRAHLSELLPRRDHSIEKRASARVLTKMAQERSTQAEEAVDEATAALVRAAEIRDPFTRDHGKRVAALSVAFARVFDPDEEHLDHDGLQKGAEVIDVGKLALPDVVLNKVEPLTDAERATLQEHPAIGRQILESVLVDDAVLSIVAWHHERWDGLGYPDGLAGESIPLEARIVAITDSLTAMISERPYRGAKTWEEAVSEIEAGFGTRFDPGLADAFRKAEATMRESHLELPGA